MTKISDRIAGEVAADDAAAAAMDAAFVDVHVTLDWVIRVHGQTEAEAASQIAIDYLNDQDLHSVVEIQAHEEGTVCDGDEDRLTEDGYMPEEELTVALYPEGTELPTSIPVAVSTYGGQDSIERQVQLRPRDCGALVVIGGANTGYGCDRAEGHEGAHSARGASR